MKTKQEAESAFIAYFSDLQDSLILEGEGAEVSKCDEWEFFIRFMIDDGCVPASASFWECPN